MEAVRPRRGVSAFNTGLRRHTACTEKRHWDLRMCSWPCLSLSSLPLVPSVSDKQGRALTKPPEAAIASYCPPGPPQTSLRRRNPAKLSRSVSQTRTRLARAASPPPSANPSHSRMSRQERLHQCGTKQPRGNPPFKRLVVTGSVFLSSLHCAPWWCQ